MTKAQFKAAAKKSNVNVYFIKRVTEGINKGWKISYSNQLSETSVSTQKEETFWNEDLATISQRNY